MTVDDKLTRIETLLSAQQQAFTPADIEAIAERASEKTLAKLGIDVTSLESVNALRDDLAYLREFRRGASQAKKFAYFTAITAFVSGMLALIALGIHAWILKP